MTRSVRWERLSPWRAPLLILSAIACLTIGAFSSPSPWTGWLVLGLGLVFVAYVTDGSDDAAVRPGNRG